MSLTNHCDVIINYEVKNIIEIINLALWCHNHDSIDHHCDVILNCDVMKATVMTILWFIPWYIYNCDFIKMQMLLIELWSHKCHCDIMNMPLWCNDCDIINYHCDVINFHCDAIKLLWCYNQLCYKKCEIKIYCESLNFVMPYATIVFS